MKNKELIMGVDFDNTIVCYDQLFYQVALEKKIIPAGTLATKGGVRDYLRQCGQEDIWTELQGYVYGERMQEAPAFPGVSEFFSRCVKGKIPIFIISHKTCTPFLGQAYDLHRAAKAWLENKGFFDASGIGLSSDHVYFDLTKQEKLNRISERRCTHFIDDLPEFLQEFSFPTGVERILFSPAGTSFESPFHCVSSWTEIEAFVFENGKTVHAG